VIAAAAVRLVMKNGPSVEFCRFQLVPKFAL
jgi:hypothetical protein